MKPEFALDLSQDAIVLLHRVKRGWRAVGEARLDDARLKSRLDELREAAVAACPKGITSKLILPDSQVLYTSVACSEKNDAPRRAAISRALDGLTPYALEDLAFDYESEGDVLHVAVVARETLEEAESFAVDNGFNPVSVVARPKGGSFTGEPFFGPTEAAAGILPKGARVERDVLPTLVTLKLTQPVVPAASAEEAPAPEQLDAQAPDVAPEPQAASVGATEEEDRALLLALGELDGDPPVAAADAEPPTAEAEQIVEPVAEDEGTPDVTDNAQDEDIALASALGDPLPEPAAPEPASDRAEEAAPDAVADPTVEPAPGQGVQAPETAEPEAESLAEAPAGQAPAEAEAELKAGTDAEASAPQEEPTEPALQPEEATGDAPADLGIAEPDEVQPAADAPAEAERAEPEPAEMALAETDEKPAARLTAALSGAAAGPRLAASADRLPVTAGRLPSEGGPAAPRASARPLHAPARPAKPHRPARFDAPEKLRKVLARPRPDHGAASRGLAPEATPARRIRPAWLMLSAAGIAVLAAVLLGATLFGRGDPEIAAAPPPTPAPAPVAIDEPVPPGDIATAEPTAPAPALPDEPSAPAEPDRQTGLAPAAAPAPAAPLAAPATGPAPVPAETQPPAPAEAVAADQEVAAAPEPLPEAVATLSTDTPAPTPAVPEAPEVSGPAETASAASETPAIAPDDAAVAYAATGVWTAAPEAPAQAEADRQLGSLRAPVDPRAPAPPETEQPLAAAATPEAPPLAPAPPPPAGATFRLGADGLVIATPEGAATPTGTVVYLGRPPITPPNRPDPAPASAPAPAPAPAPAAPASAVPSSETPAPAPEAAPAALPEVEPAPFVLPGTPATRPPPRPAAIEEEAALDAPAPEATPAGEPVETAVADVAAPPPPVADPALAGFRPRPRSEVLAAASATTAASPPAATAAATLPPPVADPALAGFRPRPRSAAVAALTGSDTAALDAAAAAASAAIAEAQAASFDGATEYAVAVAAIPRNRPSDFAARAPPPSADNSDAEADNEPEAVASAATAPRLPTRANVAEQATERNALRLNQINLIGIYGSSADRRALVRLSSGRYVKVQVGDRLDGGRVATITESELRIDRGGRSVVLKLPRG